MPCGRRSFLRSVAGMRRKYLSHGRPQARETGFGQVTKRSCSAAKQLSLPSLVFLFLVSPSNALPGMVPMMPCSLERYTKKDK